MPPLRARSSWSTAKWIAAILAIAVHVAFLLFLIFSVNWQNRNPAPVTAELYVPPAAEKIEPAKPAPEPPAPAPPKPEPPKPRAEVKPPPVEPPKPDIALKEKQERARKEQADRQRKEKEKQDAEKREAERREAEKKQQLEKRLADARERQAREADALKAQAQRERQAQDKIAADGARAKADADYVRRIQAKVRGNVVVPPDMSGNPEAIFDVVQLPSGEIIDVQLRKSSGVRAYDEAVQRAILKSSPLPRPDAPDMFRRNLTLKFRPLD